MFSTCLQLICSCFWLVYGSYSGLGDSSLVACDSSVITFDSPLVVSEITVSSMKCVRLAYTPGPSSKRKTQSQNFLYFPQKQKQQFCKQNNFRTSLKKNDHLAHPKIAFTYPKKNGIFQTKKNNFPPKEKNYQKKSFPIKKYVIIVLHFRCALNMDMLFFMPARC